MSIFSSQQIMITFGLSLVLLSSQIATGSQGQCSAQGYGAQSSATLYCIPTNCPPPDSGTCAKYTVSSHPIFGSYEYCGCDLGGEPACCHIIKVSKNGHAGTSFAVIGDCEQQQASCPPGSLCQLLGKGTAEQPYVQECSP